MPRTRLKICCIQNMKEVRLAMNAGADALGLVAEMPTGPGPISDALIAEIAMQVPPPLATFLLTCRTDPAALVDHVQHSRCNTVQLCDLPRPGAYLALRRQCPGIKIVQVIHVQDDDSLREAESAHHAADALLLDSGRTRSGIKELGGTARTHDWSLSARIVADSPIPVFLAGGLTPANIAHAIHTVRPFGVDLCNGVRTAGALDPTKLTAFTTALRSADSLL